MRLQITVHELENLGKVIREVRKHRGLSQQELGRRVGISGASLCVIESGKSNPRPKTLFEILKALDVTIRLEVCLDDIQLEQKPESEKEIVEDRKVIQVPYSYRGSY